MISAPNGRPYAQGLVHRWRATEEAVAGDQVVGLLEDWGSQPYAAWAHGAWTASPEDPTPRGGPAHRSLSGPDDDWPYLVLPDVNATEDLGLSMKGDRRGKGVAALLGAPPAHPLRQSRGGLTIHGRRLGDMRSSGP